MSVVCISCDIWLDEARELEDCPSGLDVTLGGRSGIMSGHGGVYCLSPVGVRSGSAVTKSSEPPRFVSDYTESYRDAWVAL